MVRRQAVGWPDEIVFLASKLYPMLVNQASRRRMRWRLSEGRHLNSHAIYAPVPLVHNSCATADGARHANPARLASNATAPASDVCRCLIEL